MTPTKESAIGALLIEYGHRCLPGTTYPDGTPADGKPGHRRQGFVLPFQVDMVGGKMVFRDRLNHFAEMRKGGAVDIMATEVAPPPMPPGDTNA
jgi:hypothetical protein